MWGNGTYDIGTIETLKHPHLTPHALLIPLDFLLRNGLQSDLVRDVPRRRVGPGISRDCEGERI